MKAALQPGSTGPQGGEQPRCLLPARVGGSAGPALAGHTALLICCSEETRLQGKNLVRCPVLFLMEKQR